MPLSRRTFLQCSLAASLATAAEVISSHWLLSTDSPVRIGIAGLGASAPEHLALFAAVPGAHVIGLTDSDSKRIHHALRMLEEFGQRPPRIYGNIHSMVTDPALQAISFSSDDPGALRNFSQILTAKLPVLTDFPPPLELPSHRQMSEALLASRTPIQFRLADFIYPASPADLRCWLNRSTSKPIEARLIMSPTAAKQELRLAAISAVDALFAASNLSPDQLLRWTGSEKAKIDIVDGGTLGILALPQNPFGLTEVRVHLLGSLPRKTRLVVQSRSGSIELAISNQPDAGSSLQTVMKFLSCARHGRGYDNSIASRAHVAAVFVDRFVQQIPS